MKLRQEPLHRPDDRAGRGGPCQSNGIGHGTDRHDGFLNDDVFDAVWPHLLDIHDKSSIPTLQYFHGTQTSSKAVHDCYRLDHLHFDALPNPVCPFRLTLGVGKSAELAMSDFAQSAVSSAYREQINNTVTQTTRVAS